MPNHRPSFSGNYTLLWGHLFLGSLHFLASLLSLSSLWHLFTYVHKEHLLPSTPRSIPERLSSSLNYFEEHFLQCPVGALREYHTSPPSRLLSITHWETIIRLENAKEKELLWRQLALKDSGSYSWTQKVRKILDNYSLLSEYDLLALPQPRKSGK